MKRGMGGVIRGGRTLGGVQSVPRVMRGTPVVRGAIYDVPLSMRGFGDDTIEMPEECMRPGEILLSSGVCGPDPHRPASSYETAPPVYAVPVSTTKLPTASARNAVAGMSRTTMLIAAVAGIGLVYYLSKNR